MDFAASASSAPCIVQQRWSGMEKCPSGQTQAMPMMQTQMWQTERHLVGHARSQMSFWGAAGKLKNCLHFSAHLQAHLSQTGRD